MKTCNLFVSMALFALLLVSCSKITGNDDAVASNRDVEYQMLLKELGVKNFSLSAEDFI